MACVSLAGTLSSRWLARPPKGALWPTSIHMVARHSDQHPHGSPHRGTPRRTWLGYWLCDGRSPPIGSRPLFGPCRTYDDATPACGRGRGTAPDDAWTPWELGAEVVFLRALPVWGRPRVSVATSENTVRARPRADCALEAGHLETPRMPAPFMRGVPTRTSAHW